MKKIFVFISAMLLTTVAFCQDWIYVGTSSYKDKYYIKSEYVNKADYGYNKDVIRIWGKTILYTWTYRKKTYRNVLVKSLWEIDCKNKQDRVGSVIYYSPTGQVLQNNPANEFDPFADVAPDTIGELLLKKVCSLFN